MRIIYEECKTFSQGNCGDDPLADKLLRYVHFTNELTRPSFFVYFPMLPETPLFTFAREETIHY